MENIPYDVNIFIDSYYISHVLVIILLKTAITESI